MSSLKAGALIEDAPKTITPSKGTAKKQCLKIANQLNTSSLIWLLVKRHKVAILALGNVVLLLNWVFPEWPQLVRSLI